MKRSIMMILATILISMVCKPDSEVLLLEKGNDGQTFYISRQDEMVISLEANLTTGYSWEVVSLDKEVLSTKNEPEYISKSNIPGSSGIQKFHFIAVDSGESELVLVYRRSWEPDKEPIDTYSIKINVK